MRCLMMLIATSLFLSCGEDKDTTQDHGLASDSESWRQIHGAGMSWSTFGEDDTLRILAPPSPIWQDECEQGQGIYWMSNDTLRIALTDSTAADFLITQEDEFLHLARLSETDRFRFSMRKDVPRTCASYAAMPGLLGAYIGEGMLTDAEGGQEACSVQLHAEHGFLWVAATSDSYTRLTWGVGDVSQPATIASLAGEAAYDHEALGSYFLDHGTVELQTWSALEIAGTLSGVFCDRIADPQGVFDEDISITLSFSAAPSIATAMPVPPGMAVARGPWESLLSGR